MSHICNIILPIHNALSYATECIDALLACTSVHRYRLTIINDASDRETLAWLQRLNESEPGIEVLTNERNIGFLQSCNRGMSHSRAKYVLLINSDVIVVDGWLERMLACAESDERIAAVNPLTNRAANIDIPIATGSNFLAMDWYVQSVSRRCYPDVVTGVGFCLLLRRSALDVVGLFDEVYGQGYCEDSDLCMRLTTSGYRTVVADDVYVYHKGSASFENRQERYLSNRSMFDQRWSTEYKRLFRAFQREAPLDYLKKFFQLPQRSTPMTAMRETYRCIRGYYRAGELLQSVKASIRGMIEISRYTEDIVTTQAINHLTRPGRLRVTYVLPHITIAGGVLSVVQLVNELILLGVEARIVTVYQYPETKAWKFYSAPVVYKNSQDLIENFPSSDIVVATHWSTAEWVSSVMEVGKATKAVYFLQDYESWFFDEDDHESRKRVNATYALIANKIVKSHWLQQLLSDAGYTSRKIWLGMDLGMFYPRDVVKRDLPVIMAMARASTPHRGFEVLVDALAQVKMQLPDVNFILFGDDLANYPLPFEYEGWGIIRDQNRLAELYSIADIFVDASDFQGFGRPALEAMACGTACVLTNVGGVNEYARDEYNALLVPPKDSVSIANSISRLLEDGTLRSDLIKGGRKTVPQFSHKVEAKTACEYFSSLLTQGA